MRAFRPMEGPIPPDNYQPAISFNAVRHQIETLREMVLPGLGELREDTEEMFDLFLEDLDHRASEVANPEGEQRAYLQCMHGLDVVLSHFREYSLEGINQLQAIRWRFLKEYLRLRDGGSPDLPGH